jgi:hypothetical protein
MTEAETESNKESAVVQEIRKQIPIWDQELHQLFPSLSNEVDIEIIEAASEDYTLYQEGGWDYGVSGATPTTGSIRLEVDTKTDLPKIKLLANAKKTYFHETFHRVRGYSFESTGLTLLDVAVEEGAATKFEIDVVVANPLFGHHQGRETMLATLQEVRKADARGDRDWNRWKFHYPGETPEQDRYWILYRLGTFIAEEALANNLDMQAQDLATLTCPEILALAGL